jgi:hypothetical protein
MNFTGDSVILSANGSAYPRQAIEEYPGPDISDFELIMADDGSTDILMPLSNT